MSRAPLDRATWYLGLAWRRLRDDPWTFPGAVARQVGGLLPPWLQRLTAGRRHGHEPCTTLPAPAPPVRPRVSVLLPVKDQCELLGESVASVLAQRDVDLELIVLDDGSTDAVDAVLRHAVTDSRVRVLRQPNRGLPAALSAGFRFAGGELLTWTSADNVMEPGLLARLVAFLEARCDAAMVYADYRVIDAAGRPLEGGTFRPAQRAGARADVVRPPRDTRALNVHMDNFIGPAFLYRRCVADCIGGWTGAMGVEDYDYWMRLNSGFRIEHLGDEQALYRYRWHDNSLNARARQLRLLARGAALLRHERRRAARRAAPWFVCVDPSAAPAGLTVSAPDVAWPWAERRRTPGRALWWVSGATWLREAAAGRPGAAGEVTVDWGNDRAGVCEAGVCEAGVCEAGADLDRPWLLHVASDARCAALLRVFTDRVVQVAVSDPRRWLPFVRAALGARDDVPAASAGLPVPWRDPAAPPPRAVLRVRDGSAAEAWRQAGAEVGASITAPADSCGSAAVELDWEGVALRVCDTPDELNAALAESETAVVVVRAAAAFDLGRATLDALQRVAWARESLGPLALARGCVRLAAWCAAGGAVAGGRAWLRD